MGQRTTILLILTLSACPAAGVRAESTDPPETVTSLFRTGRIVHRFDFNERPAGNLEDFPKFWQPLRMPGFPHYTFGGFDVSVGHDAPPSFYLATEGRNVAFLYDGPEVRVRTNSGYRIEGYIRTNRLTHGRACLSAHFLDQHGRPLTDTLERSRFIGGDEMNDTWVRVELFLDAAPMQAHAIGLIAWILQEPLWTDATPPRRHIPHVDPEGGAWFDDITIYSLPRVELSTSAPGQVLLPGDPQALLVVLADYEETGLGGRLRIFDADGRTVGEESIPVVVDIGVQPQRVAVDHLPPGHYHARLDVLAQGATIVARTVSFVRLAPAHRRGEKGARAFGVVVDPGQRLDPATELALLRHQGARSAKLPVWTGLAEGDATTLEDRERDRFYQALARHGFALTGVFFGPPRGVIQQGGAYVRSLIDLLGDPPEYWEKHLAGVLALHGGIFRGWQIGPDGRSRPPAFEPFTRAARNLRQAMQRFITTPVLIAPVTASVEPPVEKLPVEQVAISLPATLPPSAFESVINEARSRGYDRVTAYIESNVSDEDEVAYHREARLGDWARRVLSARHAGADVVFVPQTWHVRSYASGPRAEPTEAYVVLRTITDFVGEATPAPAVELSPGLRCLPFHRGDSTVLALWDDSAPPEGRVMALQLGLATHVADLWGRTSTLERDELGRHLIRLSPLPVFVDGVERWLIDFHHALTLSPGHVASGVESSRLTITLSAPDGRPLAGRVNLRGPAAWNLSPRNFAFNLLPQRSEQIEVNVAYPHSEPAGRKDIVAEVTYSESGYFQEIPLSFELGLEDIEAWGTAVVEGDQLYLRHVMTNRSDRVLSFRGFASVPGRQRQYRPFANLHPGDTQTVEYRFEAGAGLIGRGVRLVLREMNDGPRIHNLELIVP